MYLSEVNIWNFRKYGHTHIDNEKPSLNVKFKTGLKTAQSSLSEFTNKSNNAGTRFEALGSSLKTVGSTITTAVSLPLLALGAGAIKTASDFEAGMSKVSALSGATGDDLKMLEEKAREMGSTTKYSSTEASEALSYMAL